MYKSRKSPLPICQYHLARNDITLDNKLNWFIYFYKLYFKLIVPKLRKLNIMSLLGLGTIALLLLYYKLNCLLIETIELISIMNIRFKNEALALQK